RQLNFRFVVRDNHPGAGAFAYDTTTLTVTTEAGPFRVTAPAGGERVAPGATLEVRWDVAHTNLAPVSCANVQIDLSRDGGQSFPTMLAASTPNTGQHTVTLPEQGAIAAHVRVKCSDNVFLHISPRFSIGGGVSKFTDSSDGVCDDDCSLREAVQLSNAAPGANTITLEAGTYSLSLTGSWPDGGALEVSDDLTIAGVGAGRTIIDANQIDRLFTLTESTTLTLTNLTLRNGQANGPGGAIFSTAGQIVLQDVVIADSEALWKGGAIALEGGSLTIESSTLRDNRVRYDAATIAQHGTMSGGGAIWQSGGSLQITGSSISNNAITGVPTESEVRPDGGGIYFWNFQEGQGQMSIATSTLSGNSAGTSGMGGAIFFLPLVGSMELVNTTISDNSANVGGAVALFGQATAPVMFDFVTITANQATFVGGVYAGAGSTTLRNTILAQNSSRDCNSREHLTSAGFNLFGDSNCPIGANDRQGNPQLAALADYGGPTLTHALLAESPALNAAGTTCPATDQRGQPRPVGSRCDIGAVEGSISDNFVPATPTPTPTTQPQQGATATPTATPRPAATATPTRQPTSSHLVYLPLVQR
ncbi:choice-of-anchor Q domain-containing protein, partial [Candidatus Viridilinea mediisalina]